MKKQIQFKSKIIIIVIIISIIVNSSFAQQRQNTSKLIKNNSISTTANPVSHTRSAKILNIKALFEGFYNPTTHRMNKTYDINMTTGQIFPKFPGGIVDTVQVILFYVDTINNIPICFGKIYKNISFDTNGVFAPINVLSDSCKFYIFINHRNSNNTFSADRFKFNSIDTISYDFTTSITKAYANNMKPKIPNKAVIFTGDVNDPFNYFYKDGVVNIFDLSDVYDASNDPTGLMNGYVPSDLNGDGVVDIFDMALIFDNLNIGVATMMPPISCYYDVY